MSGHDEECWPPCCGGAGCPSCGGDGEHYDGPSFALPGSALRAASARNPRDLPCPTCKAPNRLTREDRARGYQCDACADRAEQGFDTW